MQPSLRSLRIDALLLIAALLVGTVAHRLNAALETGEKERRQDASLGVLPDGKALHVLSLGFYRLVADLFWIRTVYYIGDEVSAAAGYPEVNRLADLVTDIDPQFETVYVTMSGAIGVLKGDPDGAIALLEKGVQHVDYWKLNFLLGYAYFSERLDYAAAATQMSQAAAKGGGPPYLPLLAARLHANAGDPDTALIFIQARLREESDPRLREALEKRSWDLWINRDLTRIDQAIDSFQEQVGRPPRDVAELVASGVLDPEARDPRGQPYEVRDGRAHTDLPHDTLELHMSIPPRRPDVRERWRREQAEREEEGR